MLSLVRRAVRDIFVHSLKHYVHLYTEKRYLLGCYAV
jgi:hypothetical protein